MFVDPLSPVAPSRIRVLLLPCGRILQSRFLSLVRRLQEVGPLQRSDLQDEASNSFSPSSNPSGTIFYDLTATLPSPAHQALFPFEIYREPLVVIGIADGSKLEHASLDFELKGRAKDDSKGTNSKGDDSGGNGNASQQLLLSIEQLHETSNLLRERHPSALVHRVFTFDCAFRARSVSKPLVMLSLDDSEAGLKTILCDLTVDLLVEMDSYAKSLQALPNIETPRYPNLRQPEHEFIPESRLAGTRSARSNSPAESRRSSSRTLPGEGSPVPPPIDPSSRSSSTGPATTFDQMGSIDAISDGTPAIADRIAVHGFGSGSVGERARNKAKGRQGIILGSMYLLAGNWPRAIKELSESATSAKVSNDHVWHAKALENILICLLLSAWSGAEVEIPSICYPLGERTRSAPGKTKILDSDPAPAQEASSERSEVLQDLSSLLPDLFNNILNLYVRAATFTADQLPQIAFSESAVRFAKLLATVEAYRGVLNQHCLQSIVLDAKIEPMTPMASSAFPSKSDIATLLFRALPNAGAERSLDTHERIGILTGLASVLSRLHYHRKKAFVLRQLLMLLLPALVQSRKDSAAEQGVHPFASLALLDILPSIDSESLSNSLQSLLRLICQVYGVISTVERERNGANIEVEPGTIDKNVVGRILQRAAIRSFGNPSLKLDMLKLCINICEALPDLPGVLEFSSNLLLTSGSGIAPRLDDCEISPLLSLEDQIRLVNNVYRASATQASGSEAEYWDEFLVRDIKLVTSQLNSPTIRERAKSDSIGFKGPAKPEGPFIYNPFATKPGSGVVELLIADEEATFTILLQNLYDFDLEIEWIRLLTNDASMDTIARNVVVGPCRTLTIPLPDIPRAIGQLRISGCRAKVRGCKERKFSLYRASWRAREEPKLKYIGLSNVPVDEKDQRESQRTSGPISTDLVLTVIETQPNLIITSTSLSEAALMILSGERKTFSIQLQNTSSKTPVDILALSLVDSTSGPLQARMSSKNLSSLEIHEAEVSAYHHPPFRLPSSSDSEYIAPNGEFYTQVEVLGKPGLTHGALHVDYGHIGVPRSDVLDRFYTRQLSFPFAITVSPSIRLIKVDLIGHDMGEFLSTARPEHLNSASRDHGLLLLDFENCWSNVLEISLRIRRSGKGDLEGEDSYTIEKSIQPGTTARIMISMPTISLANCHAPIPSLSKNKRQFVVSTSETPEVERIDREIFWYREEILKQLQATWKDDLAERSGSIDLYAMKLTPRMIEAIRSADVGIELSLDSAARLGPYHFLVNREAFVDLIITITNRLSHPIQPMMRLLPRLRNQPCNVALDLSKKLAFNGPLQRTVPPINPMESRQISVGCVFLCFGKFDVSASIEELRTGAIKLNASSTQIGEELPRIWYPRSALRIDVTDT